MPAPSDEPNPITSVVDPDLGAVRRFIADMITRGAIAALVTSIIALLVRMRDLNTELVRKLASKSRKRPPNETMRRLQLELPLLFAPPANDAKRATKPPPDKPEKKKRGPKIPDQHGRPELPAHLPRVPELHLVEDEQRTCPSCDVEAKRIGLKTTEKLDVEPARYIVRQVQIEIVACQHCHEYICSASKPDEVVDRGLLGNELLVQALVDHYDDAVPWERMERHAQEQGVPLAANTLARSVWAVVDLFDPITRHIRKACLSADYTALDATRIPVLDRDHPLGIRSGALWLIEGAHRYACFFYATSGHADHLKDFLAGNALGSVMCDGSATNNCVERGGARRGGCNSHARRRLVEALRGGDARAVEGIRIYGAIFHVDAESSRSGETIEQRFARRKEQSAPLVDELRAWLDQSRANIEPKSKLGKALGYMHRQWKRLTAFLRDPRMELTNNEVERDLRRWVLDRKTWLFVGHDESARHAADALTIITTCRKFGIEPRAYIRDTLARILAGEKRLEALLPETYAEALAEKEARLAGARAA
jgi:transposase